MSKLSPKPMESPAISAKSVKWLRAVVLVLVGLCLVEAGAAYFLYRHYARLNRSFSPVGSAAEFLVKSALAKMRGERNDVQISVDHQPVLRSDSRLGYTLVPGMYTITEKHNGLSHQFTLTVDPSGHRVVAATPAVAPRRLIVTGDSAMFGWGLNDDQTAPWLLQNVFPQVSVVNLSLTSYSTVQALLQLQSLTPAVGANDIVVLTYHPITNEFNVLGSEVLRYLQGGFEQQIGAPDLKRDMVLPFGEVGTDGKLAIGYYPLSCELPGREGQECRRNTTSLRDASQVTGLAYDAIAAIHPAQVVVAFVTGDDDDPVVSYMRSKGALIADLRSASSDPDANDISFEGHAGPFWHRRLADRLAAYLRTAGVLR